MSRPVTNLSAVIISRTDSIGDVMLTLPMAGIIKKQYPNCRVVFLGRSYTKAICNCCEHIDAFLNWDEIKGMSETDAVAFFKAQHADAIVHVFPDKAIARLASNAKIPQRIGTSHRLYHWWTCNRLINFTRKNSKEHEAQLNLKLLPGIGLEVQPSCAEINLFTGFTRLPALPTAFSKLVDSDKFNLVLHPRSKGSAREWGLENFSRLVSLLPPDRFKVFVSGTREEGESMRTFIESHPIVTDLTGKLTLEEFIAFLAATQGIVAASTGPLHVASALGKKAIGIYAPMVPIHPGRWAPIGVHAEYLVKNVSCTDCVRSGDCHCIREITPEAVLARLMLPA
jgi:heptosyltransferase-3